MSAALINTKISDCIDSLGDKFTHAEKEDKRISLYQAALFEAIMNCNDKQRAEVIAYTDKWIAHVSAQGKS